MGHTTKARRTVRRHGLMTEETAKNLDAILAQQEISFGDWIKKHVDADILSHNFSDKIDDLAEAMMKSFMTYRVTAPIKRGQFVCFTGRQAIGPNDPNFPSNRPMTVTLVALRDMQAGEDVEYNPFRDTKDIAKYDGSVVFENFLPPSSSCPACGAPNTKHKPSCPLS